MSAECQRRAFDAPQYPLLGNFTNTFLIDEAKHLSSAFRLGRQTKLEVVLLAGHLSPKAQNMLWRDLNIVLKCESTPARNPNAERTTYIGRIGNCIQGETNTVSESCDLVTVASDPDLLCHGSGDHNGRDTARVSRHRSLGVRPRASGHQRQCHELPLQSLHTLAANLAREPPERRSSSYIVSRDNRNQMRRQASKPSS